MVDGARYLWCVVVVVSVSRRRSWDEDDGDGKREVDGGNLGFQINS